jgi:hypothetical protein
LEFSQLTFSVDQFATFVCFPDEILHKDGLQLIVGHMKYIDINAEDISVSQLYADFSRGNIIRALPHMTNN